MSYKQKRPNMHISYGGESVQQHKKNLLNIDPIPKHASSDSPFHIIDTPKSKKDKKDTGSITVDTGNYDIDTKGVKGSDKFASSTLGKSSDSSQGTKSASDSSQSAKNTARRKSGKSVSYKDAYVDADKSKYKTYEAFEKAAKSYNKKKYDTTEPTKVAKEKGVTKKDLAQNVTKYGPNTGSGSSSSSSSGSGSSSSGSSSSSSSDASTRKGRKEMKNKDKGEGRSRKEVKSLKLQRKAKAAKDADPKSRKAARLKKRVDRREKRIKKQKA